MTVKLMDICSKIGSGATPRGGKEAYREDGISLVRSQNVLDFEFTDSGLAHINDEQARKLNNVEVMDGDILINITGDSVARACMMDAAFLPARVNQHVAIIRGEKDKVISSYILYFLQMMKRHLLQLASSGATRNALTKGMLEQLELELPDIETQKRITSLLDSIQEKIALNRKINDNLEQQIETALLSILNSTQTNYVRLGDYLYIKGRIGWKGLKKDEYLDQSNFRIINGESLTKAGVDWAKAGYISESRYIESPEIMLKEGDILLSKDGTIGKIGYIDSLTTPTTVASGIFVIRNIKPDIISTTFIYYLLKSRLFEGFIAARTEGSVIPHLYQKDFMQFEFPLPTSAEMTAFDNLTKPMFSLIISNLQENQRLSQLRDELLPRLMSGKIDVSDIQF